MIWRLEMQHVLVAYASRHGATRGIALQIGETLRSRGVPATVLATEEAPDPSAFDGVVLGSATYMGRWLEEADAYLQGHLDRLRQMPTWLFSSGPVGNERVDKQGRDVLAPPPFLVDLASRVGARGTRVFFGRWDPSDPPASVAERLFRILPVSRDVLPIGDFRDWDAIAAWASGIADELREPRTGAVAGNAAGEAAG
jgi:menaquinone-dependent protoporphyrinogen oxidase